MGEANERTMTCPVDGTALRQAERHGIGVDYCPQCRGVWLDRGELDKIVERSAATPDPADAGDADGEPGGVAAGKRTPRRSLLADLFDLG